MAEFFIIVFLVVTTPGAWLVYIACRRRVQRMQNESEKPKQMLNALLIMCAYYTIMGAIGVGGRNFWAAVMLTIPFLVGMLAWAAVVVMGKPRRGAVAMTQDTPAAQVDGVRIRTRPQPVPVEAYSARTQPGRGPRASRIMREVEA